LPKSGGNSYSIVTAWRIVARDVFKGGLQVLRSILIYAKKEIDDIRKVVNGSSAVEHNSDWGGCIGWKRYFPQHVFCHYQCCETGRYLNSSGTRLVELSFDCPSLITVSVPYIEDRKKNNKPRGLTV
jgi:hypothetical protein